MEIPSNQNQVLNFNASSTFVQLETATDLLLSDKSFTVQAWVYINDFSSTDLAVVTIEDAQTDMGLHLIIRSKKVYLGFYANDLAGKTELKVKTWYHITWMYDKEKEEQSIYLNGTLDATGTGKKPMAGTKPVIIGKWFTDRFFNGIIANVAFWSSAIGADRALKTFNSVPKGTEDDLTALYLMNEGKGAVIGEFSGFAPDGAITGGTWAGMDGLPFRPAAKATGQIQSLVSRIKQHTNTQVSKARADANERQVNAQKHADNLVEQAHQEATNKVNNTKFEDIFFISANRLKKVNPAGDAVSFELNHSFSENLTVKGNALWQSSGIIVQSFQDVNVTYKSGQWSFSAVDALTDANGLPNKIGNANYSLGGAPASSLIGKVGDHKFLVGNSGKVPAGLSGELFFIINDDIVNGNGSNFHDNKGEINIEIAVSADPQKTAPELVAYDLAIDPKKKTIFLARHITPFQINSVNFDGTHFRTLYEGKVPITSLSLDRIASKVYFIEGTGAIKSVTMDGAKAGKILDISAPAKDSFWRLNVDESNKQIYWTNESSIWRCSVDGSSPQLVVAGADAPFPIDISAEDSAQKIYWVDKEAKAVKRADIGAKKVLRFNGVDSEVAVNDPFKNNTHFTISCWVNTEILNDGNYHGFLGKQGDKHRKPSMWLAPANGGLHIDSYDAVTAARFDDIFPGFFDQKNTWVHVAWVKEGTTYKIYKNGELFATNPAPETFYTTSTPYWVGHVDNYWKGQIAEVQIWSKALSEQVIKDNMSVRPVLSAEGLALYLPLNDGLGIKAANLVDTTNAGQLKNTNWSKSSRNYSLHFPGANSFVRIQEPFRNNEQFTIACWVKTDVLNDGGFHSIVGKQGDAYRKPGMWLMPNAKGLHYDSYEAGTGKRFYGVLENFFDNTEDWVHIAWVKQGTKYRVYKNGKLFKENPAPAKFFTVDSPYRIGHNDNYWKGKIAEVQIWSKAQTEEQINHYMYTPPLASDEDLSTFVPLNEGIGDTVSVYGPKPSKGHIRNATWTRENRLDVVNAEILYKVEVPHVALALDASIQQLYWTMTDERGRHFMMRGSLDGSTAPEELFPIACEGGIALLSKGIEAHEQRLLAYQARREAQQKAARDLQAAKEQAHNHVMAAHADLDQKQQKAHADITEAQANANQKKTAAKQRLSGAQAEASQKVATAQKTAKANKAKAQNQAEQIKGDANTQAARVKGDAQARLNEAKKERAKY